MDNEIAKKYEFSSISMGLHAFQSLNNHHHWEVRGNTSKGIFLKGTPNGLIFLSKEKYRGPLTINFDKTVGNYFDGIKIGSKGIYRPDTGIFFENVKLSLIVDNKFPWEPDPFFIARSDLGIWNNLDLLGRWLSFATPSGSFGSTSPLVVQEIEPKDNVSDRMFHQLSELFSAIRETNNEQFHQSAQNIIGLGSGLTPSGDDFLSGMALAIARYSRKLPVLEKYLPWFMELIPKFEGKTTLLSYELFKISLLGSADERIIDAFDSVMRKNIVKDEVILPISNWGSSSGFDMMSGFYLLMKAIQI